ncbi:MAG: dihydropteroate synthase [Verrucomicrobiales bacterium]
METHWQLRDRLIDLSRRGMVMGILNVTPDSFSDGGRYLGCEAAVVHGRAMCAGGAAIIDVGGESTRPGAREVSAGQELERVLPVIRALAAEGVLLSIDTSKAEVADAALVAGAAILNDVTGLCGDPEMAAVAARHRAGLIVMHMQGRPREMQKNPCYRDVVAEVRGFFDAQYRAALAAGIAPEALVFDPGIGFGKTLEHNLALLRALPGLVVQGRPLALGVSRKSFLGALLDSAEIEDRGWPTVALTAYGRERGVPIHRVHEVAPNLAAMRMTEAILFGPGEN